MSYNYLNKYVNTKSIFTNNIKKSKKKQKFHKNTKI